MSNSKYLKLNLCNSNRTIYLYVIRSSKSVRAEVSYVRTIGVLDNTFVIID